MIVAPLFRENVPPEYSWIEVNYYEMARERGYMLDTLAEYLIFANHLFENDIRKNTVCLKNSLAYDRTLVYKDVPYEVAEKLYAKDPGKLTEDEKIQLMDFMFHWIIKKSIEIQMPIQIHTGYFAGNGRNLANGNPIQLTNLFIQYPEARFILFHGGYPWTREWVALGKMFPNVYLDLCWLAQISRQTAVSTLDDVLDCVPYNKIFWGGDATLIEEATGALEVTKDVVAEVLTDRIQRGVMDEDMADNVAQAIFRGNAIRVFNLKRKVSNKF